MRGGEATVKRKEVVVTWSIKYDCATFSGVRSCVRITLATFNTLHKYTRSVCVGREPTGKEE